MQLIGLLVAFVVILVLVGRRVSLSLCLVVGTVILALASLMPPREIALSVYRGLTKVETVELLLDVAVMTSLAGVLKRYGLLGTMVRSVTVLLGGARLAIMAVPSLIGALPVIGGAILSAPMADGLGDHLRLSRVRKAAVNLVFRHAWFFVAPFAPSLLLASKLAQVPLGSLILRQAPFALTMLAVGYVFLLARTGRADPKEPVAGAVARSANGVAAAPAETAVVSEGSAGVTVGDDKPRSAAWPFVRSASPLIAGVVLSLGLGGVSLPLYISIGLGLVLALFLSRGHEDFGWLGLPVAWKSIQWNIVLTLGTVMVFGQMIRDSGASGALVDWLVGTGLPVWVLMVALPVTVGYIAGMPEVPIGVSFPALLPMALPGHTLATASALYCVGFIAYFVSPLHLCQILSSQFFGVTVPRLYREYWPVVAALAVLAGAYVWVAIR